HKQSPERKRAGIHPAHRRARARMPRAYAWGSVVAALIATAVPALAQSASTPAPTDDAEDHFTVILTDKVITVGGKDIDDGIIVLNNGKITNVGRSIEYPRNAKVINARDKVVMPGLINPHARYSLPRYGRSGVNGQLSVADELRFVEGQFDDLLDAG